MPASTTPPPDPASRLARRLTTTDAVFVGLGSMIGAGVFAAVGPAAGAAGSALLLGLGAAALVALCNATSSAQLAAVHPASGGTYVYGRERLGQWWGYLAGWAFLAGKTASCAAMALTFGAYLWPDGDRLLAVAAVAALTTTNLLGIRKTARATQVIVALVLLSLVAAVVGALGGGEVEWRRVDPFEGASTGGVLEAGALLFFAFAGYARIATLGEEVRDPSRTIPRAIPAALGLTLVVYATVAVAALAVLGGPGLAGADAPLEAAVDAGALSGLVPVVRIGAAIASLGVLLSLLAGVARTGFAMASDGEIPRWFDAVHPGRQVPHRAEVAVAAAVVMLVLFVDLGGAIGFSAVTVLTYYGITNVAALRLRPHERRWPRALAVGGVVGCAVLALSIDPLTLVAGIVVLTIGIVLRLGRRLAFEDSTRL